MSLQQPSSSSMKKGSSHQSKQQQQPPTTTTITASIPSDLDKLINTIKYYFPDLSDSQFDSKHDLSKGSGYKIKRILRDIGYIKKAFKKLGKDTARKPIIDELISCLLQYEKVIDKKDFKDLNEAIDKLKELVAKIKLQIPKIEPGGTTAAAGGDGSHSCSDNLPSGRPSRIDEYRKETLDVLERHQWGLKSLLRVYKSLPSAQEKLCLLSFAIFPWHKHAQLVINKRVLFYWWVGESFIDPPETENKTIEEIGDEILNVLIEKGFVEPAAALVKKSLISNNRYVTMHPVVRSLVVSLAKDAGVFDIDDKADFKPAASSPDSTRDADVDQIDLGFLKSKRAILLEPQGVAPSTSQLLDRVNSKDLKHMEAVQTIFNVDESSLDIKPKWFSRMKYLSVLHLGSWGSASKPYIELKDPRVLKEMKKMKQLRLLSLQGVSRVMKLEDAIFETGLYSNLIILDLRACHNLESLPSTLGSLLNLTHLDISDCHLPIKMPLEISRLFNLQVLKGFVVSDNPADRTTDDNKNACTLSHLADKLQNLRKLSIVVKLRQQQFPSDKHWMRQQQQQFRSDKHWMRQQQQQFPNDKHLMSFKKMIKLRNLKISWERIIDPFTAGSAGNSADIQHQKPPVPVPTAGSAEGSADIQQQKPPVPIPTAGAAGSPADIQQQKPPAPVPTAGSAGYSADIQQQKPPVPVPTAGSAEGSADIQQQKPPVPIPTAGSARAPADIQQRKPPGPVALPELTDEQKGYNCCRRLLKNREEECNGREGSLPDNLEKLDLRRMPYDKEDPPSSRWLVPDKLNNLNRLYIRGGDLTDLGVPGSDDKYWNNVRTLRLKFLPYMKITWDQLLESFPKLVYLEKYRCPQLVFFPCDENGVWTRTGTGTNEI